LQTLTANIKDIFLTFLIVIIDMQDRLQHSGQILNGLDMNTWIRYQEK